VLTALGAHAGAFAEARRSLRVLVAILTTAQQLLRWATVWPQETWAEKCGAAVPLSVGDAGSPSNTMWPGPRPTSTPSGILIHPTVFPQYTNVTDRQDRQQSVSTRRTVLQTVAQKLNKIYNKLESTR